MKHMNRREVIRKTSLLMGGALFLPSILKAWSNVDHLENTSFFISTSQDEALAQMAELIIPTTDTPGAIEAGVPAFVRKMLADCYFPEDSERFLKSLDAVLADCQSINGKAFAVCSEAEQTACLRKAQQQSKEAYKTFPQNPKTKDTTLMKAKPFFYMLKELVVIGYFTSEIGATQALRYIPIPGKYDAEYPYKPGDKAWAI